MPLNKKGEKIMKKMKEEYGNKKGEAVFYAMENSGKLKGVKKAKKGMMTNLKPVPAEKKNSLGKLPPEVRNRMGYAKYGKMMKKSMGGDAKKGYGQARTSGMGLQDESLVPGKGYEYIKDLI